jgi:hypothetical protein
MLGILLSVIMWELVKALGSVVPFPFNTSDTTMPNVWTMVNGAFQPEMRGSSTTVLQAVMMAAGYSLLIAMGGFIIGVSVGLLLAITMQRFAFMERGLLPFVIAGCVVLHLWALHTAGQNNPVGILIPKDREKKDMLPFHPYFTVKDGFAIIDRGLELTDAVFEG